MNKTRIVWITILFIILQMIFIWHIDICLGAVWRGNILTNGFAEYDPLQIYHVCLYGVIIITGLMGISIFKLQNSKDIKNQAEPTHTSHCPLGPEDETLKL